MFSVPVNQSHEERSFFIYQYLK